MSGLSVIRVSSALTQRSNRAPRLADQNFSDKGAEHGVNTDGVGNQSNYPRHYQNWGHDGYFADETIVRPTDQREDQPATEGKARQQE